MHVTHDETDLRLRVRQLRWESEGVVSVELEPDQAPAQSREALPPWSPGAHIDVHLPGGLVRQYSLCGTPDSASWRIAVLREPDSRGGSRAVHELLRPGQLLDVVGPRNNFELVPAVSYRFVAGGIGITPLLAMIAAADRAGAEWTLDYGGRSRASMAFVEDLERAYGSRVRVHPQDETGLLDLAACVGEPRDDTLVYCCGPEPLLRAVEAHVGAAGWPAGSLRVERFAPKQVEVVGEDEAFELELATSGTTIKVLADQTILEALEAHGYAPPSSCREGICGTCETAVVAGEPDHRDSLLSEEEKAANDTMMICVGRACSRRLVLDL
ncbi:MAG: PDR/VanB family oxidoreductase [Marmoricola sp.]